MSFQTRSEENGIAHYPTLKAAREIARIDQTIWKISFSVGEERVRLVRYGDHREKWVLADLLEEVKEILEEQELA